MSSTIKIVLESGVIASTERQKQTVLGLGLKGRHSVNTLKDTPAIRGMVNKVVHLAKIIDEAPSLNPWAGLPADYELGAVKPKAEAEKKAPKKPKALSEGNEDAKPKAAAGQKKAKPAAKAANKTKAPTKKVKGK